MSDEQSIRDELVQILAQKRIHTNESLGKQGADADAILASPVIRRIQAEALRYAAHDARNYGHEGCYDFGDLMARADRIERGETA